MSSVGFSDHELTTRIIASSTMSCTASPPSLRSAGPRGLIVETCSHDRCVSPLFSTPPNIGAEDMVGVSLEESAASGSSLGTSTTPTTVTGDSTTSLSPSFLRPPSPIRRKHARREGSPVALAEAFVKDVSFLFAAGPNGNLVKFASLFPCLTRVCHPAFLPPPFKQQVRV